MTGGVRIGLRGKRKEVQKGSGSSVCKSSEWEIRTADLLNGLVGSLLLKLTMNLDDRSKRSRQCDSPSLLLIMSLR